MSNRFLNALYVTGMALINTVVSFIVILNFISGIAGGIWLAILGKWLLILAGIVIGFIMPYAYWIAALPAMGLAVLTAFFADRKNKLLAASSGFLASLYSNGLMIIWVIWVFGIFMKDAEGWAIIPHLFWGYATMMAPLSFMASKEPPESTGTTMAVFFAQICYFIYVLFYFLGEQFLYWLLAMIALAILFSLFSAIMSFIEMVAEEEYYSTESLDYESEEIA